MNYWLRRLFSKRAIFEDAKVETYTVDEYGPIIEAKLLRYTFSLLEVKNGVAKVLCEIEGKPSQVRYMLPADKIIYTPSVRVR